MKADLGTCSISFIKKKLNKNRNNNNDYYYFAFNVPALNSH